MNHVAHCAAGGERRAAALRGRVWLLTAALLAAALDPRRRQCSATPRHFSCCSCRPLPPATGALCAPSLTLYSTLYLQDLRFRSTKKPLAFASSHGSPGRHAHSSAAAALGAPLLPPHLLKLRLEGCHLTEVGVRSGCKWG